MKACPRCRSRTLEHCSDMHGGYEECFMCGFVSEEINGPPPEWSAWTDRREYLDPVLTSWKIALAKNARLRDPEKMREYNRAYKARRRALRRALALA